MHDIDSVQQKGHRSMLLTQTSASKITTKEQNYATWRYYFLANFITYESEQVFAPLSLFLCIELETIIALYRLLYGLP